MAKMIEEAVDRNWDKEFAIRYILNHQRGTGGQKFTTGSFEVIKSKP
jgi:hypothetical protein